MWRTVVAAAVFCAAAAVPGARRHAPAHASGPPSLADTAQDGAVRTRGGRLVVDPELRRFFDHHLAGAGEEDPAAARARLMAAIDAELAHPAEARALAERYLLMREQGRELRAGGDLEARFAAIEALRRDTLGPEAAKALFADEDADLAAALARRRGEAVLTPAEAASIAPLAAWTREQTLPPSEIQSAREQAFGADGAARLAELDQRRAEWNARLADFRARRDAGEDAARLLDAFFTPEEQTRVKALERLAGNPVAE